MDEAAAIKYAVMIVDKVLYVTLGEGAIDRIEDVKSVVSAIKGQGLLGADALHKALRTNTFIPLRTGVTGDLENFGELQKRYENFFSALFIFEVTEALKAGKVNKASLDSRLKKSLIAIRKRFVDNNEEPRIET